MAHTQESDNRILKMHFVPGTYSRGLGIPGWPLLSGGTFMYRTGSDPGAAHVRLPAERRANSWPWKCSLCERARLPRSHVPGGRTDGPPGTPWQRGLSPAGGADGTRPFWNACGPGAGVGQKQLFLQVERIQEVTGLYKHPRCSLTPARA